eukprot:jgi/Hompol1/6472/HPOL_002565-RA
MPTANVARNPNDPAINIFYETFGSGPQHVLFINGLGGYRHLWDNQVEFLQQHPEFTTCIFDNRGIGLSSAPSGYYSQVFRLVSTTMMAEDAKLLLKHLGWSHVHIVGTSLGGMIAQELAIMLGDAVLSLTLHATCHRFLGVPLTVFGDGLGTKDSFEKVMARTAILYPKEWLVAPSKKDPQRLIELTQLDGVQSPSAFSSQQAAAITHYCDSRLSIIRDLNYPVLVLCGSDDGVLFQPSSSVYLAEKLNGRLEIYVGGGHVLYNQDPEWFNRLVLETFRKGHVEHIAKIQQQQH